MCTTRPLTCCSLLCFANEISTRLTQWRPKGALLLFRWLAMGDLRTNRATVANLWLSHGCYMGDPWPGSWVVHG